jgi:hypothetical protein
MAYNRINKLLQYKNVIDIVNEHYEEGITTYKGIWRTYVNPVYPMSYKTFIDIINMPNIDKQIQHEHDRLGRINEFKKQEDKRQLKLFSFDDDQPKY